MTRAEVVIDGDVGPLRKMLREGVSAMNQFNKDSSKELGGLTAPLEGIAGKFSALVAVIGGGALFKNAIDETVKFTKEVNLLARTLGISATEATAWNVALGDIYQDADALAGAIGKLNRVIAEDETKLNKLGIATRDTNGQLKAQGDIFLQVTDYLGKFKQGTDRNVEGARIFGKSWAEVAPLLNLTKEKMAEADEKARQLGLTMTEEKQGTVKAYRAAMNDVGDVMLGLKNAVAQAVMPVLTRLGEWFAAAGPIAITGVKGAIGGLSTAFMGLQTAVVIVWETVKSFVYSVAEPIRSLGEGLLLLVQGDFKGATEVMMGWTGRVGDRWSETMARIADESRRTANDIVALWGPGTETKRDKSGGGATAGKGGKPKAEASQMEALDLMLAKQKQMLIEGGFIREYESQQELDFWKRKLELANLSAADRLKIDRKVAQLTYEVRKKALDQERELDVMGRKSADDLALSQIENRRTAAKALLDNEQITKLQFLQLEVDYEAQRYAIQQQALQDRLALLAQDPNANPVEAARIKQELLLLEQDFQRARLVAMGDLGKEGGGKGIGAVLGDAGSSFSTALGGVLAQTQTWAQATMTVFKGVRDSFVQNLITEPMGKYIASQARMLAMKLGFVAQETTAQAAGSAATVGIKAAETGAVVSANAVQAGTGAAASQAPIPIIGPYLALAAMAAIFAAVSGFGGGARKSAAKGYDIPAGLNPVTQLHEEEMVLPAKYANAFRGLVANGSGEGGAGGEQLHNHYHAAPGETPESIRRNSRAHADEMTRLYRNGWRPKR